MHFQMINFDKYTQQMFDLFQGNILNFTKTLMDAMPKQCKLPRYDYGSPGVLGYYQVGKITIITGMLWYDIFFPFFKSLNLFLL